MCLVQLLGVWVTHSTPSRLFLHSLRLQAFPEMISDSVHEHSQVSVRDVQNLTNFIAAKTLHFAQDKGYPLLSGNRLQTILQKFPDLRSVELNVDRRVGITGFCC